MNGQQVPPWLQKRPMQPVQGMQQRYPQNMGYQQPQPPPQMRPPMGPPKPAEKLKKKLPSQKKKRILRLLVGLLVFFGLMAVVTGIYFVLNYV